jgi:ribosomal-protein-alanine N-acetyltransferase
MSEVSRGTAAVALRAVAEADLPALFEIQLDAEAQAMAAFTDPRTCSDLEAYLRKWRRLLDEGSVVARAVLVGGELVGSVGCFEFEGDLEVTYWVRREQWGRGIATAALAGLLVAVPQRPLFGRVAADNAGSARVLERNGFLRIGEETSFAEARGAEIQELIYRLDAAA